ncbi:MAG: hypothetical protein Q9191_008169 [Dirinaria sp. TL-2023a]
MLYLQTTLLFLPVLLTPVSAAPSLVNTLDTTEFKVQRQPTGRVRVRNGMADMSRAFAKYGWSMPQQISNALFNVTEKTGTQEATTSATPQENDVEFLCPVGIGDHQFMMDFDTGSSDLWVFNTELSLQQTKGHAVYDPSLSKTFKRMPGSTFSIHYGDGSTASGPVGKESVTIGSLNVPAQAIGLPKEISQSFIEDTNNDGLLGLAFKSINNVKPTEQDTFFGNALPSLKQRVFTANLKHATPGAYEFGFIDPKQFKGNITYTPVDASAGFWQFSSKWFKVGDGPEHENQAATPAIADTGTSLMLMDDEMVQAYYAQVPGARPDTKSGSGMLIPCDAKLPDLHVELGQNYFGRIPGPLLNFHSVGDGMCFGGIQSNMGNKFQVFGDVMFKSQFVIFDANGPRLGFAAHA